ncbi:MAG: OmpA family protein [Ghiorsea sp.]|nr:OmpA family protein [Ghiorsea sp.]
MIKGIRRFGMGLTQRFNNAGLTRAVCRVVAVGVFLLLNATVVNAAFLPGQSIISTFTFTATNIPTITSNKVIVTSPRTPAVITFLHFNSETNEYTPADVYHPGNTIYVEVADGDQNTDPYTVQTVTITLIDSVSGDTEVLTLTETGPNTGKFRGSVGSIRSTIPTSGNNLLALSVDTVITATYTDPLDAVTTVAAAALVDPFGIFFDSATGLPVDGVTVTIINSTTGLPAQVFGDDGVSAFPSTLISGSSVTDASGSTYDFPAGRYRFPLMALGTYYLQVTPPLGYKFPSQVADAALQALPTSALENSGQYALLPASRGANFNIVPGPPIKIDIPLDFKGINLFVQKTTATPTVAIGDRVNYQISIENVHETVPSSATTVSDVLPLGFRYQAGSTTLDGVALADPTISANGRQLTFNVGSIDALSSVKLMYTTVVGANTKPGKSTNTAFAGGTLLTTPVQSNVSQATVTVREDLIRSKGYIAGVVFVDDNMNELHDEDEKVVQGVRIFMEDGRNVVTDQNGRYHFDGVKLGTHVVQMDEMTIQERYQALGLTQSRFSGNDYSQFAEVTGGGLVRANFRLIERAPVKMPVTVIHALSEEAGLVWADVDVKRGDNVQLFSLDAFYMLPKGWTYSQGTASVDGTDIEPQATPAGLVWQLDPEKEIQHIRLAMRGHGESGLKQAIAYVRFSSPGTKKGRTGLAKLKIHDTLTELRDQYSFALNVRFKNRKAVLPDSELKKLESLLKTMEGLVIRDLVVEGHTNNIRIAPKHRHEFANNQVLSQARADFIADYFKQKLQLDDSIVSAVGYGKTQPIYDNNTAKGRQLNRRVILKIRADKVTHDFGFELQDRLADAYGEALDSWDYKKESVKVAKVEEKEGILSPSEHMSLPHATNAVRLTLDTRLEAELLIDGQVVGKERIGFKSEDPDTGLTTYTYIGVDFGKTGKHTLQLRGLDPFGNARYDETITVVRTGAIAKIKLVETANNIADGKTPVRFRLEVSDNRGVVINGMLKLQQLGGDLGNIQSPEVSMVAKEASQQVAVNSDGWVEMAPVSSSGSRRIVLGYGNVHETIELYIKPEARDWILVGFAEGTIGYNQLSGAVQPVTQNDEADKFYQDGRVALYAKGQISGDFLLTMSYNTQAKTNAEKNSRFGDIDPNSMYTIYGDATQQQFDGTSSKKLYLKIERDRFYALFGDYNTGLSTTELTRYSRTFTGIKAELHEDALGFSAFATQTSLTSVKDDIRGNGTSGLYRLSRQNIVTNSETIRVETVDRFKSEVILESIQLTRHLDYDIDYITGSIWFKQPILSKDVDLNPIIIRVEYESDDKTDQFTVAGGRVYVKPTTDIEIGGTFVSEGYLGGSNTLSGMDAKIQVNDKVEVRAEAASSASNAIVGQAWKVEARLAGETLSGTAYARSQDDNFGLGQQLGSENSTLKVGADAQYRFNDDVSVNTEVFRQEVTNTGATRDMASVQYRQSLEEGLDVRGGVRVNRDVDGTGRSTGSTLGSIGATKAISSRLKIRADHEEALATDNGIDFPSRSTIAADYLITAATTLSATQEWTRGNQQDTSSTRLGVRTQPWNGAQMSTSYEQQLSENGKRSFANAGLLQTWKIDDALSFSASMDKTKVVTTTAPTPLNLNAATVTGGESFTAYSVGADYKPGTWAWTNRLEWRKSDLSVHHGVTAGLQGHLHENLPIQMTLRWQRDILASNALTLASDASLRAAWRPSYDQLILLNRLDIRRNEQTGSSIDIRSLRYINNMTANWQTYDAWQLRFNHGIKLTDETIGLASWSGLTDLFGTQLIYDFTDTWDFTIQASVLRVRHLNNYQPNAGMAVGYNMFDNFWLSLGYNFVGYYDQDFTAAEYARKGIYMRFRFKYDQDTLEEWLK